MKKDKGEQSIEMYHVQGIQGKVKNRGNGMERRKSTFKRI
jgi:hypothetical protein